MTLAEKKEQLIEDLAIIEDPLERLAYVMDKGKEHPPLDPQFKTETFAIPGCLSNLWLVPSYREGQCHYACEADAAITQGVAGLLCDFYSGHEPEEILAIEPDFLGKVGITQHISGNRRNGLNNLGKRILGFARSCRDNPQAANA